MYPIPRGFTLIELPVELGSRGETLNIDVYHRGKSEGG